MIYSHIAFIYCYKHHLEKYGHFTSFIQISNIAMESFNIEKDLSVIIIDIHIIGLILGDNKIRFLQ